MQKSLLLEVFMDHFSLPLLKCPFPITSSLTDVHIANFKTQKANRLQHRKIICWPELVIT